MPRTVPAAPCPTVIAPPSPKLLLDLTIAVVTPLFGGGHKAGVTDPDQPVSAKAVRGHLRFWWRACNAHRYPSAEALFHDEAQIWGQTHQKGVAHAPSAVDVEVTTIDPGQEDSCVKWSCQLRDDGKPTWRADWGNTDLGQLPSYALFPFQGERPDDCTPQELWDEPPATMRSGVIFRVQIIEHPQSSHVDSRLLRKSIADTVWAWIAFGGVGARTRRGCGSLSCMESHTSETAQDTFCPSTDPSDWLSQRAANVLQGGVVADRLPLPFLKNGWVMFHPTARTNPIRAWVQAVDALQTLRQGEGIGRRSGSNPRTPKKLGQSYWPEADAVRRYAGRHKRGHEPRHPAREYFPRAEFGLPLIIQFNVDERYGDPSPHTLMPPEDIGDRMASPVIVKPLALPNGLAVPMVLWLNTLSLSEGEQYGFTTPLRLTSARPNHPVSLPDHIKDGATAIDVVEGRKVDREPWQGEWPAITALERHIASPKGWRATKLVLGG